MSEQSPQPPTTPNENVQLFILKPASIANMKITMENALPENMPCNNRGDEFSIGPASATTSIVRDLRAECRGCAYRQPCLYDAVVELVDSNNPGEMIQGGTTPRQRVAVDKEVQKAMRSRNTDRKDVRIGTLFTELMRKSEEI